MLESELVEGAEYEGEQVREGSRLRGKLDTKHKQWSESDGSRRSAVLRGVRGWIADAAYVWLDTLVPVTPIAETGGTVGEKDRLFETGCSFCGKRCGADGTPRDRHRQCQSQRSGAHGREHGEFSGAYSFCCACKDTFLRGSYTYTLLDDEYRRRAALAANAQKLVSGSVVTEAAPASAAQAQRATPEAAEPERISACTCGDPSCPYLGGDCLAWKIRRETLAAEEKRRRRYEERCAAYRQHKEADDQTAPTIYEPASLAAFEHGYRINRDAALDAAIARVKPTERDEPAYVNLNWPEADPNDP